MQDTLDAMMPYLDFTSFHACAKVQQLRSSTSPRASESRVSSNTPMVIFPSLRLNCFRMSISWKHIHGCEIEHRLNI